MGLARHRSVARPTYTPGMRFFSSKPQVVPSPSEALPGRPDPIVTPGIHAVLGTPIAGPWPDGTRTAVFGLGCFWGDEKDFWQIAGRRDTAVGYAGGYTPNPTYEEVCSGRTGHAEVVLVAYDPAKDLVRAAAEGLLGAATTRPRACARGTTSGTSTAPSSSSRTTQQRAAAEASTATLPGAPV